MITIWKDNNDGTFTQVPKTPDSEGYTVVAENSLAALCRQVNKLLWDGWRLAGGINSQLTEPGNPPGIMFFQAMKRDAVGRIREKI